MKRARLQHQVLVEQADDDLQESAQRTVTIYEDDGTTLLGQTLYDTSTGGSPVANPTTTSLSGFLKKYALRPQAVKLGVAGVSTLIDSEFTAYPGTSEYLRGPVIFDVEAYANEGDLNDEDGTFKITVDATYAWNAALTAAGAQGFIYPGGFGWSGGATVRYNSKVYRCLGTINGTVASSLLICGRTPGSICTIYSDDEWYGPPVGSPAYIEWTALGLTEAQRAALAPQWDGTRATGCYIIGVQLNAQSMFVSDTAPTNKPAVGWLMGATEYWNGTYWTGGGADSTGWTMRSCGASGYHKIANWALVNHVISDLTIAGQQWLNEGQAHSFYCGVYVLDASGDPSHSTDMSSGSARQLSTGGGFDSVWYPSPATPVLNGRRLGRFPVGAGNITLTSSEFHDMSPNVYQTATQSNKKRTVLLSNTIGMMFSRVIVSCSGVRGHFEFWGQVKSTDMNLVEVYDKAAPFGNGYGGRANYFIYCMEASLTLPIFGLRVKNLQGSGAPKNGWIGCGTGTGDNAPAFVGLYWSEGILGTYNGSQVPFFKTLANYPSGTPAAQQVNLAYSEIDLYGCGYEFGGSIGETVTLRNVPLSGEQYSSASGGTNKAERHYIDGTVRLYGPLTVDGDMKSRHLLGGNTALATGDIVLAGDWGAGGAGPVKSLINGTDTAFKFRVTTGTGPVSANPTATITFKTAFASAPIVIAICHVAGGGAASVIPFHTSSVSNIVLTYLGTVSASTTYDFHVHVIGF